MGDKQWLQAVIPTPEWQSINKRRLSLGLKWPALLLPAVKAELDRLEDDVAKSHDATPTAKGKGKKASTRSRL